MRLLLDECVPRPLRKEFAGHEILTIEEAGFKRTKKWRIALPIAVMIISARTNRIENLLPLMPDALTALSDITSGEIIKIEEQVRGY